MEPLIGLGEVIEHLRNSPDNCARRRGWNGKHQVIKLQEPGPQSKMTEPYIHMEFSPFGGALRRIPWLASQADLLAEDWELG